jgi:hypothetical protein
MIEFCEMNWFAFLCTAVSLPGSGMKLLDQLDLRRLKGREIMVIDKESENLLTIMIEFCEMNWFAFLCTAVELGIKEDEAERLFDKIKASR